MTFREFQEIIKSTYYEKDSRRGLERTFLWLVEEFGEFARAVNRESREKIELELSDLIAWIFSVANLLDIDVEKAVARYAGGCTSGHAMSGLADLQLPSFVAVLGFFIGGLIMTWFILPYILRIGF